MSYIPKKCDRDVIPNICEESLKSPYYKTPHSVRAIKMWTFVCGKKSGNNHRVHGDFLRVLCGYFLTIPINVRGEPHE